MLKKDRSATKRQEIKVASIEQNVIQFNENVEFVLKVLSTSVTTNSSI